MSGRGTYWIIERLRCRWYMRATIDLCAYSPRRKHTAASKSVRRWMQLQSLHQQTNLPRSSSQFPDARMTSEPSAHASTSSTATALQLQSVSISRYLLVYHCQNTPNNCRATCDVANEMWVCKKDLDCASHTPAIACISADLPPRAVLDNFQIVLEFIFDALAMLDDPLGV
jgi:hypothetical protein